jgi:AcrR family transcriptional regulator
MPRPQTMSNTEILAAARRVFAQQGHAATTRDVAHAAGISPAVLYQRFGSKDDLFFAAMLPPPPDVTALLGVRTEAETDVEQHFVGVAQRILAYFEEVVPAFLRLITHPAFSLQSIAEAHEHILAARLVEGLAIHIADLQARGLVASVDAQAAAQVFIAAIHSLAIFAALPGMPMEHAHATTIEAFVAVFWRGLKP